MAFRSNHAAAASAASRSSKAIQPATDRRGGTTAGALAGATDSLRTSRIAASDRSSAASVAADSYR